MAGPPTQAELARRAAEFKVLARSAKVRERFANAWVLTDRDVQANDNAEHLYRHLRSEHPEVNAWFVIDARAPECVRLERDGFRLVFYGTDEHVLLMLNARHLISSHVDEYVVKPLDPRHYGPPSWKFTFLQHGVMHNDLSRWLNSKDVDLLITSTPEETRSLVADGTPYILTGREVVMTGLPRHDRLHRLSAGSEPGSRNLLLIAPTWRRELMPLADEGPARRGLSEDFWESSYARSWFGLLHDERLRRSADAHGLEIAFAPHPVLQHSLSQADLPDHVRLLCWDTDDVQLAMAQARLGITDYSSVAFDVAYCGVPVVYFQFDRAEFFSGRHAWRRGTFSYEADGFGPVVTSTDAVVEEVQRILDPGQGLDPAVRARIASTFPLRDDQACARVFTAIKRLYHPVPFVPVASEGQRSVSRR
jgi:hypothetical protein